MWTIRKKESEYVRNHVTSNEHLAKSGECLCQGLPIRERGPKGICVRNFFFFIFCWFSAKHIESTTTPQLGNLSNVPNSS